MEMTKILIHLIDSYETEKFDEYRMETLVAIATRCPQKVNKQVLYIFLRWLIFSLLSVYGCSWFF